MDFIYSTLKFCTGLLYCRSAKIFRPFFVLLTLNKNRYIEIRTEKTGKSLTKLWCCGGLQKNLISSTYRKEFLKLTLRELALNLQSKKGF